MRIGARHKNQGEVNENIYRALTFFTIEHLAERDNFLASLM